MSCHCIQQKKIAAPPKMAKATLPRRWQAAPPKEEGDFIVIKICNFNQFSLMCSNFVVSVSFLSDKKRSFFCQDGSCDLQPGWHLPLRCGRDFSPCTWPPGTLEMARSSWEDTDCHKPLVRKCPHLSPPPKIPAQCNGFLFEVVFFWSGRESEMGRRGPFCKANYLFPLFGSGRRWSFHNDSFHGLFWNVEGLGCLKFFVFSGLLFQFFRKEGRRVFALIVDVFGCVCFRAFFFFLGMFFSVFFAGCCPNGFWEFISLRVVLTGLCECCHKAALFKGRVFSKLGREK